MHEDESGFAVKWRITRGDARIREVRVVIPRVVCEGHGYQRRGE